MPPVLFQLSFIRIQTLWVMIALGIIFGLMIFYRLAQKSRSKVKILFNHIPYLFIWALLMARIIFIATNWELFSFKPFYEIFYIWDQGLSANGAAIGIIIASAILAKQYEDSIVIWLDKIIVALIASTIFGNVGAFFEGLNYGNETSLPWGVTYESGMVKYAVPIHPTQIYSAITSLIITIILYQLNKRKFSKEHGKITLLGIGLYSSWHFIEGFFRGDDTLIQISIFRESQIISLIATMAVIAIWLLTNRKRKSST